VATPVGSVSSKVTTGQSTGELATARTLSSSDNEPIWTLSPMQMVLSVADKGM